MKLQIDLKSLAIGILLGLILVLVLGTGRGGNYQCTIANEVGTQNYMFAVLNTSTGNSRITYFHPTRGDFVILFGELDNLGNAKWEVK